MGYLCPMKFWYHFLSDKWLWSIVFLTAIMPVLQAQTKIEREFKIRESEVPVSAREFIRSCELSGKVKWYREENGSTISFEAKTRHRGKKYSIEFSEAGALEDAEELSRMQKLPAELSLTLTTALRTEFKRFRVEKIQIQYSGSEASVLEVITRGNSTGCTVKYELVVAGVSASENGHFELLFDSGGVLLERTKLIERGTENIEY